MYTLAYCLIIRPTGTLKYFAQQGLNKMDDIVQTKISHYFNANVSISNKISFNYFACGLVQYKAALVQAMT